MADQSLAVVLIRLVVAVVVVIGLLLLTARLTRRVGTKTDGKSGAEIRLISRQPLSRSASIAIVRAGNRTLVLGFTDQQVTLLSEQTIDESPGHGPYGLDLSPQQRNASLGSSNNRVSDEAIDPDTKAMSLISRLRERSVRRS